MKKSPYQKSNSEWASQILELLKLNPGGPYLTSDGSVRYGVDFKHSEGKVRKTSRKAKGSDDQESAGGGAFGTSPMGTDGATFTIANQNSTTNQNFPTAAKENEKQKDTDNTIRGIEKVVKKKPKIVEKHHDDCGDCLDGLGDCFTCHHWEDNSSSSEEEEGVPIIQGGNGDYFQIIGFLLTLLHGTTFSYESATPSLHSTACRLWPLICSSMTTAIRCAKSVMVKLDPLEFWCDITTGSSPQVPISSL